jgi:sugar lactone lactonase YvrE
MVRRLSADLVVDARDELGEAPCWDPQSNALWWADMAGGRLHRRGVAGEHRTRQVDVTIGAIVARNGGGLMLAVDDGFASYDDDTGDIALVAPVVESDPSLRMNDGKCDARGRFYASSVARDGAAGRGALWRLDPDLSVHGVAEGLSIGNGLAWSGDGRRLYFIDSAFPRVDVFDVVANTGDLRDRRTAFGVAPDAGSPDGMAIDDDDCLWVALFGGGAVHRYAPSGELLAVVELPVRNVTSAAFGGHALTTLFITTAGIGDSSSNAGALFAVDAAVAGAPAWSFAG